MTTTRVVRRALIAAMVAAVGACSGGRRVSEPARPAPVTDSTTRAARADTTVAAPGDTTRMPPATAAAQDSATRKLAADSAARAAARADSVARKPVRKAATTKRCVLDFSDSPPETRVRYQQLADSSGLMFIGGGFVGHCQGEKNQIRADSAEHYEASGVLNLFGNVVYTEPAKLRFEAQHATYFTKEERLFADGNVVATQLSSGSTFRGSSIEYLRPMPGTRPSSKLIAPNRPTVQLMERDSAGKPGEPVNVTANTMVDEADSVLFAWGAVAIVRTTIIGESDSASFDKFTERARLIRSARITNRDREQPFRLFGDTIDLFSKDRKLDRVVALHNGNASNDDVVMQAERLDLRFADQKLDRAYASGAGRAKATTASQQLDADSIAIRMPEQRVRQVVAIGRAVATGAPDTTKIKSEDRDVLRGDTVTAWFDSTSAPSDTAARTRIREIRAFGNASSLFQIASKEGPNAPAALNYVRGMTIHLMFDSGQVKDVTVDSSATGLYLEPVPDSLSDSTKAKGTAKPPVRPPTGVPPASPEPAPPTLRVSPLAVPESRRRP